MENLSFLITKPATDARLAVPYQKRSVGDAAARTAFFVTQIASSSVEFRLHVIS